MSGLMWLHLAGGIVAILSGTAAAAAPKGGPLHVHAGSWFVGSMLVLGVTATVLARLQPVPESGLGGILTCYFILTSWVTARRRDGRAGRFEMIACAAALGTGALVAWGGFAGEATTPAGRGPIFAIAAACLLAGLLDLRMILGRRLSPAQRIARHLWRMCVAFFIATGSFFLGQQDVLPAAVRGSPLLLLLGFAPLGLMLFWLARVVLKDGVAPAPPVAPPLRTAPAPHAVRRWPAPAAAAGAGGPRRATGRPGRR